MFFYLTLSAWNNPVFTLSNDFTAHAPRFSLRFVYTHASIPHLLWAEEPSESRCLTPWPYWNSTCPFENHHTRDTRYPDKMCIQPEAASNVTVYHSKNKPNTEA